MSSGGPSEATGRTSVTTPTEPTETQVSRPWCGCLFLKHHLLSFVLRERHLSWQKQSSGPHDEAEDLTGRWGPRKPHFRWPTAWSPVADSGKALPTTKRPISTFGTSERLCLGLVRRVMLLHHYGDLSKQRSARASLGTGGRLHCQVCAKPQPPLTQHHLTE